MVLLDTCAIIWDALDQSQLSSKAKKAIDRADQNNALVISAISIWEIAMLVKKGRIKIETTAAHFLNLYLQSRNVSVIQISPEIAELSTHFGSDISNDPADRLIAATSIIHNAQLVTADQKLIDSELVDTLW
ncbi:MAG: type II toxin-antitoxin system VapC family toxin [Pseudomonadales bacterium]|nr:type II toxin-antitoxin system VapC family toxin [Pseudomonadales bacterium]